MNLALILQLIIMNIVLIDSMVGILLLDNLLTNYMILLTGLIIPICLLTTKSNQLRNYLFLLGILLIIAFSTHNFFIWFISFESVLIPMIYIISKGSSSLLSRYRSIYRFTLYTLLGGLFLLIGLISLIIIGYSNNYYYYILGNPIHINLQIILFPLMLIAYLIKLPILPFHIWLPDTHGEAPTSGSVILAALLLKLGAIGLLRWLIPILPLAFLYYRPLLVILGSISALYGNINTLRQIDLKKLIAYSSIGHMGFILMGIGSLSKISIEGIIYLLVSHGFVSSLLFLLIGSLYVRTNTRYIIYYRGLSTCMPIFSIMFFLALLLNSSLPPSLSFVAEFYILQSTFLYEHIASIVGLFSVLLSGIYSIWLFCRIAFSTSNNYHYVDITLTEFILFTPLIFLSWTFSFFI